MKLKRATTAKDLRGAHFARIRTFELIVNVTGPLEGTLEDWPSHIQDRIYEAMERKAAEVQLPLAVCGSMCGYDVDEGHYIRVILSEIVAAHRPH